MVYARTCSGYRSFDIGLARLFLARDYWFDFFIHSTLNANTCSHIGKCLLFIPLNELKLIDGCICNDYVMASSWLHVLTHIWSTSRSYNPQYEELGKLIFESKLNWQYNTQQTGEKINICKKHVKSHLVGYFFPHLSDLARINKVLIKRSVSTEDSEHLFFLLVGGVTPMDAPLKEECSLAIRHCGKKKSSPYTWKWNWQHFGMICCKRWPIRSSCKPVRHVYITR